MLDSIKSERLRKLNNIKEKGIDPYPAESRRSISVLEVLQNFISLSRLRRRLYLTGRIRSLRDQGGLLFFHIDDGTGFVQGVAKKNNLKDFSFWKNNLDIGDFVEISGFLFKTKRGERSLEVRTLRLLVKTLRPIPTSFYGLHDTEIRLRKRYLDLILHPEVKEMFIKKSKFWDSIRAVLKKEGFLEVETPVLEMVPGGADAEPFVTHHNALDTDFYLRISLEISLKKLMVGGFPKIFEIGRIFRNEGIDAEHLQDYTQLEFYWAYADYNDLMRFVEKMYKTVVKNTCGRLITELEGKKINWGKKWPKVDYYKIFKEKTGIDLEKATLHNLFQKAVKLDLKPDKSLGRGRLIDLIFKKLIRPTLIQPCLLIDPPVDIEPLAKRIYATPYKVARFQVVACGTELGKGFSEANDSLDQRERFEEQMKLREGGDVEAQRIDEDFLEALEYGMPPTAGFGLSERFFATLMGKPIRETVFFPLMRRKDEGEGE